MPRKSAEQKALELKREQDRKRQANRSLNLSQQGIKTVKVDVLEQDAQTLMQQTGLTQKAALTKAIKIGNATINYVQQLEQELNQMVEDYKQQGKDIQKNRTYTTKLTVLKQLTELLDLEDSSHE